MSRKMSKPKELIKLRQKPLRGGGASLYLDIYQDGRRAYEFLRLYLIPERSTLDKVQNRETLRTAQAIKAQRLVEMQNTANGLPNHTTKGRVNLVAYAEAHTPTGKAVNWKWFCDILRDYAPTAKISTVNKPFVLGYIKHLHTLKKRNGEPLNVNSISALYDKIVTLLNVAEREGIIAKNPAALLSPDERPHRENTKREYLTASEVAALIATPTKYADTKSAFLFCCFCGLRFSDMIKLTWADIKTLSDGSKQAEIKQQKTAAPLYLPLSANALKWLPTRPEGVADDAPIFPQRHYNNYSYQLTQWVEAAKINKRVTWHISRHTYATMLLTYGADIYTTSKLLGHSNVTTTQIYAKVIDASKRAAVNLIPDFPTNPEPQNNKPQ